MQGRLEVKIEARNVKERMKEVDDSNEDEYGKYEKRYRDR